MKKLTVAILGSTSHIAKGLIYNFLQNSGFRLHLFSRSPDKLNSFLNVINRSPGKDCIIHEGYKNFNCTVYNAIINCIGVGTFNKLQGNYTSYFTVGEEYDNMVIRYLINVSPEALYISFSSGAVYGRGHLAPVENGTMNCLRVNHIAPEDYYAVTRLNSEAKHRAFYKLKIVDLRLFSYFSRFIDLNEGYFITEVIDAILQRRVFLTDHVNIVRDYVHPEDLFSMVKHCIDTRSIVNAAFDVISTKPVEKIQILDFFSDSFGLKYNMVQSIIHNSSTGQKNIYCSNCNNALAIGYRPKYSSIETIKQEAQYILSGLNID
jgi:nucleoside-diphosphate-sugar epimerase